MRKQNRVYISCPMTVDVNNLDSVIDELLDKGGQCSYWIRGSKYSDVHTNYIKSCDVFVVIPPTNRWGIKVTDLTRGVKTELELAVKLNKRVFYAYRLSTEVWRLYTVDTVKLTIDNFLQPISGSYEFIDEFLNQEVDNSPDIVVNHTHKGKRYSVRIFDEEGFKLYFPDEVLPKFYDKRILLLI